jgi:hypothetical protein
MVKYLDRDLLVPLIETYFCVGQDPRDRSWTFQNAASCLNEGLVEIDDVPGRLDCMTVSDHDVEDAFLGWSELIRELADNKTMQDRGMTLAQRGQD